MPARRPTKGARSKGAGSPTPIQSTLTSPVSSAHPSAYPFGAEWDAEEAANNLPISSLTIDIPVANKKPKVEQPKPFRFLDLPSELRVKIYGYHFTGIGPVVDLESGNYSAIHKKLTIFRVCRQIYHEASHTFYGSKTFRMFPIDGRFSRAKKGLLARLKPQSREHLITLELRLGPGWNKPYRSWVVNDMLGLKDCVNVRRLNVFIEVDPSDKIFNGFRKSNGFYEAFSQELLDDVLQGLPHATTVQFDANSSVKKAGDMTQGLLEVARVNKRRILWGPERGWTDNDEEIDHEAPVGPSMPINWHLTTVPVMVLEQQVVA